MPTLILMRHAKSSWDQPGPDHDRPLAPRGHASARAMGDWLRRQGAVPDAALCSSARRTRDTFAGLGLECPVDVTPRLYHASAEEMLSILRNASASCLLLVGHNPGIADLAARLVRTPPDHPRFADYPTCATLIAELGAARWDAAEWHGATARAFAIPREVIAGHA